MQTKLDSRENAYFVIRVRDSGVAIHNKKADSRKDYSASAECMDCRAIATALARNDKVGRVDCHADFQSARNDGKNAATQSATFLEKVDSRIFTHNAPIFSDSQAEAKLDSRNEAQNLKTPAQDSRICDEKSGFCERVQGRILGVCNCSTREAIHDLSRKAESSKQKPTPKPKE